MSKKKEKTDFRETLYTVDAQGRRKWVYPTIRDGFYRNKRRIVAFALILVYLCLPWISIGGEQAVLLDIPGRRFVFFGATFWATDTKFLFLILASLAFSLFFFTSLFGRIWCGWACPETVFLEFVFRAIETKIEGNPSARRKLDTAPMSFEKLRKKILKYGLYVLIAWVLASTVLAYFIGREPLLAMMSGSPLLHPSTFTLTIVLMSVLLFQFGWFREQFCTVLCPYARFQSVLLDDSSLVVGYDTKRGEPRGKASDPTAGHCVDCELCVQVCPTGIDIRNGLQLECIQCAACADACDSVMVKIGRPPGLVRYDTEKGLSGAALRFLRPRVLVYASILAVLGILFLTLLATRTSFEATALHSKSGVVYTTLENGDITNQFELHIHNKDTTAHQYMFHLEPLLNTSRQPKLVTPLQPFPIPAHTLLVAPVFVEFSPEVLRGGSTPLHFRITDETGTEVFSRSSLLGPG